MGWLDEGGNGSAVDVAQLLDAQTVGSALAEIVTLGALVSIGTTSDGGALGVTVTLDGRWRRQYFRDAEDLSLWLGEAALGIAAEVRAAPASSGPAPRSRRSRAR